MMYQIMSWDSYREEVQDIANDWNDGRSKLTSDEVLYDLLRTKFNPQWGIEFESADELESIDGFRNKALYTQSEDEAYKARDMYFDEALYSVFSMREMAESIVKTFNEMEKTNMKKFYEFRMYNESGEYFNFESYGDTVIITANTAEEAKKILIEMADAEYEDETMLYSAYEIKDIELYKEMNRHHTLWN